MNKLLSHGLKKSRRSENWASCLVDLSAVKPGRSCSYSSIRFPRYESTMRSFLTISSDRKSTRLNSSHLVISYAVFCLKKKKETHTHICRFSMKKFRRHA